MKTELGIGEVLVKEGRANLQRGLETVGGWLYLTSDRLIFESHRFNVQRGPRCISLRDVVSVRKCWTRFLGLVPVFPNSLCIETAGGDAAQIVVGDRMTWLDAIETTMRTKVS